MKGCLDPTAAFFIQKLLQAFHKQNQTFDSRLPTDRAMLHQLTASLSHTISGKYQHALFQAMFSLAFYAFLRIGEIAIQTVAYANPHLLMLHQIQIQPQHLTVHFTSSKHSN